MGSVVKLKRNHRRAKIEEMIAVWQSLMVIILWVNTAAAFPAEMAGYCRCEYDFEAEQINQVLNYCNPGYIPNSVGIQSFYHSSIDGIICECVCVLSNGIEALE